MVMAEMLISVTKQQQREMTNLCELPKDARAKLQPAFASFLNTVYPFILETVLQATSRYPHFPLFLSISYIQANPH